MMFSPFRGLRNEAPKNRPSDQRNNRRHQPRRLLLEQLEDRRVLSTLGQIGGPLGGAEASPGVLDVDANVYYSGSFTGTVDFDPGIGVVERTADGTDGYVARFTPQGELSWVRQMDVYIAGVTVDAAGTPYVHGGFSGTVDFGGGYIATSAGGDDPFVLKMDPASGNTLWARTVYGSTAGEAVLGVSVGADGSIFSTGNFSQQSDFDPSRSYSDNRDILTATGWSSKPKDRKNFAADAFVWKLDSAGNFVSAFKVGGTQIDRGEKIKVEVDVAGTEFLYLQGAFQGTADFDPGTGQSNRTSAGSSDVFFARYAISSTSATLNWVQSIGGPSGEIDYRMATDSEYLYLGGRFYDVADFDPSSATRNLTPVGGDDAAIAKYRKTDGGLEWVGQLGGPGNDGMNSNIVVDDAGMIYVGGFFEETVNYFDPSGNPSFLPPSAGGRDGFVLKLDSAGTYQNSWRMGGPGSDYAGVIGVAGGTIYIRGRFEATADFPNGGTLTDGGGGNDAFLLALDQPTGSALVAASMPATTVEQTLTSDEYEPLVAEALARWQRAGADTSRLANLDIQVADLAGPTLAFAAGSTIWLDVDAAGWGWFVDATPWDDSEFSVPGNQGEQNRMDLLTALAHEMGHLLDFGHSEGDDVMAHTLADGTRRMPAAEDRAAELAALELYYASDELVGATLRSIGLDLEQRLAKKRLHRSALVS